MLALRSGFWRPGQRGGGARGYGDVHQKVEAIVDGMGGTELYLDEELTIPEPIPLKAAAQMKGNSERLAVLADHWDLKKMEVYLDNICNFPFVRVDQANDLRTWMLVCFSRATIRQMRTSGVSV